MRSIDWPHREAPPPFPRANHVQPASSWVYNSERDRCDSLLQA